MRRIHKFIKLSLTEKVLFFESAFYLVAVGLMLRFIPFKDIFSFVHGHKTRKIRRAVSSERITWMVEKISRQLPFIKCLGKALVSQAMLTRRGFSSQLMIGVAKDNNGKLEAHAWVEKQGQVIVGNLDDLSRFEPLIFSKDNFHESRGLEFNDQVKTDTKLSNL
jgi:hypothetical protein